MFTPPSAKPRYNYELYAFEGPNPRWYVRTRLSISAVLVSDVIVGAGVYILALASLRGDYGRLITEAGSNLRDGCIMHMAAIPACIVHETAISATALFTWRRRVGRDATVGMNSVIMDGAVIGEEHCRRQRFGKSRISG